MKQKKPNNIFLALILFAMAISPAFALGEGNRNLFLIGVMSISPIIILRFFEFDKLDLLLLLFLITIAIFPSLLHPDTMRWSTVLYSIMFGLTFIAYKQMLRQNNFTVLKYYKTLKFLIFAYFIVLLIQQFCVLTGLPVFNLSNYNVATPWKLNSLAAEPSHSDRIVGILMYSYITIKEKLLNRSYELTKDSRKDKWVWIAFIWTMITMGSGTAFLFITIFLLKFVNFKNFKPLFIIGIILLTLVVYFENIAFDRTLNTTIATLTLDETTIIEADHSASVRITPFIILIKMVELSSTNAWFGHGVDYVSTFLSDYMPGVGEGFTGGGLFQLWLEYGFIAFCLFVLFTFKTVFIKGKYLTIVFWFLLVFLYGINNQIVWLCIILLFTNNYFLKIKNFYEL